MTEYNDSRGISRRELLARAALIGAGLAVGPLLLAACANTLRKSTTGATTTCKRENSERWKSRNSAPGA